TVARLGGDEFTIIISDVTELAHLEAIAQKLITELATPFQLGNQTVHVSASIGICLYPNDADNIESLMKNADQAMYAAKNQGRNRFSYFTPAMQEAAQIRLSLSNDMRLALQRQEFLLHYQPQVSIESGRVTGLEALVRWQHPEKGLIPPGVFIPIAEDTGLILPLGEWVLRTACYQLKQWREQGMVDVQMSVNLSARQFRQENLAASISSLLEEIGLPASSLELEITESLAMDNPVENTRTLHNLRNIGVGVAIDDFGTGHSSLGYLKDFPISCLKLDRSFIMHIETEPNDVIIVSAAIELAHDLGMDVVAEGVETSKQVEYLYRLRCDIIQGYYYCRPLPAGEVIRYITDRNKSPSHPTGNNIPPMDVLVIDDDEFICTMMASVFDSLGHRPHTVTNPIAGLDMIQQDPGQFGLILVDMLMPKMSGIDLVQAIRKINRDVPIVICTSYSIDAIHKAFKPFEKTCNLLNGINCFILEKPFTGDEVAHLAQKIFHVPAHLSA
ncbi:MAG TPA: EAL domain-containing protein, partial [Gammaproteobacteria bacterium]|nr:EAL domain-containing protein [Gammaproteobacteria bacterium]